MQYGNTKILQFTTIVIVIASLLCLGACSPHRRLSRLLRNHPNLVENKNHDTVVIREGKKTDTTVIFKTTYDTIQLSGGTTIIRNSDTFRFITRIQPCTTYISKRETIFPKDQRKEKAEKGQEWKVYERLGFILLCILLTLSIFVSRK